MATTGGKNLWQWLTENKKKFKQVKAAQDRENEEEQPSEESETEEDRQKREEKEKEKRKKKLIKLLKKTDLLKDVQKGTLGTGKDSVSSSRLSNYLNPDNNDSAYNTESESGASNKRSKSQGTLLLPKINGGYEESKRNSISADVAIYNKFNITPRPVNHNTPHSSRFAQSYEKRINNERAKNILFKPTLKTVSKRGKWVLEDDEEEIEKDMKMNTFATSSVLQNIQKETRAGHVKATAFDNYKQFVIEDIKPAASKEEKPKKKKNKKQKKHKEKLQTDDSEPISIKIKVPNIPAVPPEPTCDKEIKDEATTVPQEKQHPESQSSERNKENETKESIKSPDEEDTPTLKRKKSKRKEKKRGKKPKIKEKDDENKPQDPEEEMDTIEPSAVTDISCEDTTNVLSIDKEKEKVLEDIKKKRRKEKKKKNKRKKDEDSKEYDKQAVDEKELEKDDLQQHATSAVKQISICDDSKKEQDPDKALEEVQKFLEQKIGDEENGRNKQKIKEMLRKYLDEDETGESQNEDTDHIQNKASEIVENSKKEKEHIFNLRKAEQDKIAKKLERKLKRKKEQQIMSGTESST